jgi:hypothetical protein
MKGIVLAFFIILGSADKTPPTSFHRIILEARSAAPIKQAVVSVPPRPSVVTSPFFVFPVKPEITIISFILEILSLIFFSEIL